MADIHARLHQAMGLDVQSLGEDAVAQAVRTRVAATGAASVEDYARRLLDRRELQALIEEVAVPETSFFRDGVPFTHLASWATGTWLPEHPAGMLRVLSAPCSSGEEPYSVVMALLDAGFPGARLSVDGVDIRERAIAWARQGHYTVYSQRRKTLPPHHVHPGPAGFQLTDAVRRPTRFRVGNLVDTAFLAAEAPYDAVFCRNVLIYLDTPSRKQVLRHLERLVTPGGLLFVGAAEVSLVPLDSFRLLGVPGAFALSRAGRRPTQPPPPARRPTLPPPSYAPPPELAPPVDLLVQARQLANAGKLEDAAEHCQRALAAQGPAVEAYVLLGVVALAQDRAADAEALLTKALYLQPDHLEALACLAAHKRRQGDAAGAALLEQRADRAGRTP